MLNFERVVLGARWVWRPLESPALAAVREVAARWSDALRSAAAAR
jgi:hypothetical protein